MSYVHYLGEGLHDLGHEVCLLSNSSSEYPASNYIMPGFATTWVDLQRGISDKCQFTKRHIEAINRIQPHVLVNNYCAFVTAALPFIDFGIIRLPVVHNILPGEVNGSLEMPFWWDYALCVSDFVRRAAINLGPSEKIGVCELGVKHPDIAINRAKIDPGNPNFAIRLIWVGRVEELQKRVSRIPLIARRLYELGVRFSWDVLGDGSELAKLKADVRNLGLEEYFRFHGCVSEKEVFEVFSRSHVLVLTSDFEGLPQVVIEAMGVGVVPVVTQLPGSTDSLINAGKTGFLCRRGDIDAFSSAAAFLARNPGRFLEMSAEAKQWARQEYSHIAFAKRFLDMVDHIECLGPVRASPLTIKALRNMRYPKRCSGLLRIVLREPYRRIRSGMRS